MPALIELSGILPVANPFFFVSCRKVNVSPCGIAAQCEIMIGVIIISKAKPKNSVMKNIDRKSFAIRIKGNYMIYDFHCGDVVDYLTCNDTLYRILAQNGFSPFLDDGRIRFTDNRDNAKYRIADLALACYSGRITSFETWKDDIQKFLDYKHSEGFEVDHADCNSHNNTILNLSLMEGTLNRNKNSIVARFKLPVILSTAYIEDEYRIQVIWKNLYARGYFKNITLDSPSYVTLNLLCEDEESFVDCLQRLSILETDWSYPAKENGKWINSKYECWCSDIENSLRAQSILATMDREDFNVHHRGGLDTFLKLPGTQG